MQARVYRPALLLRPPTGPLVFIGLLALVTLWSLLCALSHSAPDLDGMEQLVWAASLELGYLKHPPLPSWLMYYASAVFGRPIWLPFLMGQLSAALALWFIWKLGCDLATKRAALIATALVSLSAYFSLRGTIYNHNTAQLWSICASIWLFYRAQSRAQLRYWLALGALAALAMLTKYSAAIQFFAFLLFIIASGKWREPRIWLGILLAAAVFALFFSPHLYWLWQHDFAPLRYADSSLQAPGRLQALGGIFGFGLDQLGRLAPMLLALLALVFWYHRRGEQGRGSAANDARFEPASARAAASLWEQIAPEARQFLLWVGAAPFVATVIVAIILGAKLQASWASTFFVLAGFYCLALLRGSAAVQMRRAVILVVILQLLMATGYALARGPLARLAGFETRSTYPGAQLAALARAHWQEHQPGRPIRTVVANTWLGGNLAVRLGPQAQVLIDADFAQSPWLDPATALACGAFLAYSERGRAPASAELLRLYAAATFKGQDTVAWGKAAGIDFNWAIIPASTNCLQSGAAK